VISFNIFPHKEEQLSESRSRSVALDLLIQLIQGENAAMEESPRKISGIREVAEAAAVSISTVSAALNGRKGVSDAQRAKIVAIADKMGYRPNRLLAAMAASRFSKAQQNEVPLVLLTRSRLEGLGGLSDEALAREAARTGYTLSTIHTYEDRSLSASQLSRMLYHRGVQGLFFYRMFEDHEYWKKFDFGPFALVSFDEDFPQRVPGIHKVRPSGFEQTLHVWREVGRRGYRRPGAMILNPPNMQAQTHRLHAACLYGQQLIGRNRIPPFCVSMFTEHDAEAGRNPAHEWFQRYEPDVLIVQTPFFLHLLDAWNFPHATMLGASKAITGFRGIRPETFQRGVSLMDSLVRSRQLGLQSQTFDVLVQSEWHEGTSLPWVQRPLGSAKRDRIWPKPAEI